jgi:DNA-binding transcriptional MerR regulator
VSWPRRPGRALAHCVTTRSTAWCGRGETPTVTDDAELRVVAEIRARLAAGFGLAEIRPFVECLRAGNQAGHVCPDSVVVLRRKLAEVDGYLDQLTEVRDRLRAQLAEHRESRCRKLP